MTSEYYFIIFLAAIKIIKAAKDGCKVNEAGVPACSQLCAERSEQYTCSCLPGYVLADDNQTCFVTGVEPRLVYVVGKKVSIYHTEAGDLEPLTELQDSDVTGIGFGPGNSVLLVSNHGKVVYRTSLDGGNMYRTSLDGGNMYRTSLDGGNTKGEPVPLIDTGLKYVTSVTVDWVTSNIYLVDSEAGTVVVCTWRADNCSVLVRDLQRPYSAAVDIKSRKLLWTEWGMNDQTGSINTADLDGTQHTMLLDSLSEPRNLVLDATVGALFWVAKSPSGYIIQSMNFKSEHKKVYGTSSGFSAPSVSVLSDQLYVTEGNGTNVINKFTGQVLAKEGLGMGNITVAAVYHPVLYDTQGVADPCGSSPCSHLCVPSNSNQGYRCLCPLYMESDVEGKCTRKEDVERLLVSGMTGVYEIPMEFIGNHNYRGERLLEGDVNCMVYDSVEGRIFYYDASAKAIHMVQSQNPQLMSSLYKQVYSAEGMTHDPSSRIIYWTTTQGKVYAGKEDGTFSSEIMAGLHRPRGITVDTENGYMYICDWGSLPQILRCHMDGTHCDTFVHADRGHPNMVVIAAAVTGSLDENKALYWTDSELDMIGYASLGGDGVRKGEILLNRLRDPHPYNLVVTDDTIYFTDLNTRHVYYIEKSDPSMVKELRLGLGSLYGMDHVLKSTTVPQTTCSVDNGGCTHLCLIKPGGQRTCLCPESEANTTCIVERKELPVSQTPENTSNKGNYTRRSRPAEGKDSMLLVILLVTGVVILLLVISVIVFCYHRNKQRKQSWMLRFVHYMKSKKTEDAEGLVSGSTLSMTDPNFKQFDNIDYPEDEFCVRSCYDRNDGRETSMISADSAFTEMKDFETYSSIDNL